MGLTLSMYRKTVEWMKGIARLWISHLLAASWWQEGLKIVPREEYIAQSISKNKVLFFQELILNFNHSN